MFIGLESEEIGRDDRKKSEEMALKMKKKEKVPAAVEMFIGLESEEIGRDDRKKCRL